MEENLQTLATDKTANARGYHSWFWSCPKRNASHIHCPAKILN